MQSNLNSEHLAPAAVPARICTCGKPMFRSSTHRSFSFEYRSFECWSCGRRQTISTSGDSHRAHTD
jgi:hypothetical protein